MEIHSAPTKKPENRKILARRGERQFALLACH